jgi:hypothetical protein
MKDYLAELVRQEPIATQGRTLAREYLQARILASLQRAGAMIPLAFHGGTALRFTGTIQKTWISPWKESANSTIFEVTCGQSGPN